jgi:TolB-like protein
MRSKLIFVLLACSISTAGTACAQSMDQEMTGLADQIGKALVAKGSINVAAVDFANIEGQPTELGRFLSDQLTVEIVATSTVSMVDRANIKHILAEHNLTVEGLVDPANAKKLGEFAGVDTILTGVVTELDDGIVLTVRAVSTSSAKIVAAGRIKFPKTSEIQLLLNRSVSASPPGAASPSSAGGANASASYEDANSIVTKDIGALRVALKSISPVRFQDQNGRSVNGLRCSFTFTNRETQRPIAVAMNASPSGNPSSYERGMMWGNFKPSNIPGEMTGRYSCYAGNQGTRVGDHLRTTITDEHGTTWSLFASEVAGVGVISVGRRGVERFDDIFSPADIASLMRREDENGTNMTQDANCPEQSPFAFVFGSTTEIAPGQSSSVTMNFVQDAGGPTLGALPKFFQLSSELVVGLASGGEKSYSLYNLMFDRVGIPQL